jgi:hypothetical protein
MIAVKVKYPALEASPLDHRQGFFGPGAGHLEVGEFWRWYLSCLTDNTTRGVLAEFLVARAVGAPAQMRIEWDAFDITAPDGTTIEVKSASRWQTWGQQAPSKLSFGIAPTQDWDAASGTYGTEKRRQADVYVFALLDCDEKADVNALDLGQWTFYVLPRIVLDTERPKQGTITLGGIEQLGAVECRYAELQGAVREAATSSARELAER